MDSKYEGISYNYFIDRLFELQIDCNHEQYMAEIFIPFLRMCCPKGVKIVPVFDDRQTGRKTDRETPSKKHMDAISAKQGDKYIVPDYVFVDEDYSYKKPIKQIVMVETKKPDCFLKDSKWFYKDLKQTINKYSQQIEAEIDACETLIYTDGLKWMFLEKKKDLETGEFDIVESIILYKETKEKYRSYKVIEKIDSDPQRVWIKLTERIKELLTGKLSEKENH